MYIIHLKYIKSNKKSLNFYIRLIYSSSIIILFPTFVVSFCVTANYHSSCSPTFITSIFQCFVNVPTFVRFWLYFFRDFPIFHVSLLPIQPLIISAFVSCLHYLYFWCKFVSKILIIIFLVQRVYTVIFMFLYNLQAF